MISVNHLQANNEFRNLPEYMSTILLGKKHRLSVQHVVYVIVKNVVN